MKICKSTRHSKITGDFAERMVLYWLSKYGFECARIDHTGIDIIARNPLKRELMGISVKSRSRSEGKEQEYLSIRNDSFTKAEAACKAFGCVPYFAIVVDAGDTIRAFILPAEHLRRLCPPGKLAAGWKMSSSHLDLYAKDPHIKRFEFKTCTLRWWEGRAPISDAEGEETLAAIQDGIRDADAGRVEPAEKARELTQRLRQ